MSPECASENAGHLQGQGLNRNFCLPRLPREYYLGDAVVHWTMPIAERKMGWLTDAFHAGFRECMLHTAAREGLFCPTYCLMPDHLHLVSMGMRRESDQRNGSKFLREYLGKLLQPFRFQHQAHDSVLREKERKHGAFAKLCFYIMENPVAEALASSAKDWPFIGAVLPGYPTLHPLDEDYWPLFWKLYAENRDPDAGNVHRPPWGKL
jgi:putative transposase